MSPPDIAWNNALEELLIRLFQNILKSKSDSHILEILSNILKCFQPVLSSGY